MGCCSCWGFIISKDVVPADITRAHKIYRPNVERLKGRTTLKGRKRKATPIPQTMSRRVSEDQIMYADIFFACGDAFLITLVQPLEHFIDKTDTKNLRSTIRHYLGRYGQKQIRIIRSHSDNEKGITAMALDFSGSGIALLQVGVGTHVPHVA